MNLIDLWKHVTWDHVGSSNDGGDARPNFDLEMPTDFGTAGGMKIDPGMIDYVERVVLDLESPHQHQHQHHQGQQHHSKRGEMDLGGLGFGLGMQIDQLDAAAASMGVCGRGVHVASA
jgi:hypothetical protein